MNRKSNVRLDRKMGRVGQVSLCFSKYWNVNTDQEQKNRERFLPSDIGIMLTPVQTKSVQRGIFMVLHGYVI
jgi:hypothetical protein